MLRPIGSVSGVGQHFRRLQMWVTGCGRHRSALKSLADFWRGGQGPEEGGVAWGHTVGTKLLCPPDLYGSRPRHIQGHRALVP